jgi:DNA polymerase/3'-5' exonuclease PolX
MNKNLYLSHYLSKLSNNFEGHKHFAFLNASESLKNTLIVIDENSTDKQLRKIKYVGPMISKLLVDILNNSVEDAYKLDEQLMIDNYHFYDIAKEVAERFGLLYLSELKQMIRTDKSLLSLLTDDHLKVLELHRTNDWFDEIKLLINPNVYIAGSTRRGSLVIHDFDLVSNYTYQELKDHLSKFDNIEIINKGKQRVRIQITKKSGDSIEGDVRLVPTESLYSGLLYFTGPKEFNIRMRGIAKAKGMLLNEYGIDFEGKLITFDSEEQIFEFLGMKYLYPNSR